MANLKSAIKRVSTNENKRIQNESFKSEMRTQIKKVERLIEANDATNAAAEYKIAVKKIDKTVQRGIIHQNNGNRQKTRLAKNIQKIGA